MQLTKHKHSCVRFDHGERTLVIDPGGFSDVAAALDGADAVLITHEHMDHIALEPVRAALSADSRLQLWAPASVAAVLAELGEQVVAVGAQESFEAAGFAVQTFGGQHALIHPLIPIVANVAYLVDGAVYHPGDSFVVPPVPVSTLLLPANAPWSKMSEIIDFTVAMRASRAYPIHDALVNDAYGAILQRNLVPIAERFGVEFSSWEASVTV
ncbi:MAG: MBL fold metallo-hydrolase [Jatrophihabitans sp.]|uniref:MBL fold metallo-hydrolase n=1 Tax=Jatrophihabitans sp. TaxID=1932789 RepID=UPI0039113C97